MPLGLSWGTAYTHPAYEPNRLLACIAVPPSLSLPPSLTSPIPSSPLAMATDGGREYPPRPLRSRPRLHSFLPTPLARGPASSLSVPDSASVSVCSIDSVHRDASQQQVSHRTRASPRILGSFFDPGFPGRERVSRCRLVRALPFGDVGMHVLRWSVRDETNCGLPRTHANICPAGGERPRRRAHARTAPVALA